MFLSFLRGIVKFEESCLLIQVYNNMLFKTNPKEKKGTDVDGLLSNSPLKQDTAGCTIPSYVNGVRYEENLLRNRKNVLMAVPDFVHPYGGQQHPLQKINYFAELGRKRS